MKHTILCLLLIVFIAMTTFAQSVTFHQGDTVQTPDGRTGKVESFKNEEMAKVRFGPGANDTQYFMLTDLKVVEPPKPPRTGPVETFRVGDIVEDTHGKQLTIDSISGDTAVVRYGVGKYNVYKAKLEDLVSAKTAALNRARENTAKITRAAFADESQPFSAAIGHLAHAYDRKFRPSTSGFTDEPATYEQWRKELDALSVICQKYPNITNPVNTPTYKADPDALGPADWCKIAEQRTAVINKMHMLAGEIHAQAEVEHGINQINEAMRSPDGYVKDDVQLLLYDRSAWGAKNLKNARKNYTDGGTTIPPEIFVPRDAKVSELKAQIDRDAPTRSWKQPPYSDAGLEATVRSTYPGQFPGAKVFKTGMNYATWKSVDDRSVSGSGSDWTLYKDEVGAYKVKLGLALVKLPNQPFCQMRDFQFTQFRQGGGYSAAKLRGLGNTGIFVKCP